MTILSAERTVKRDLPRPGSPAAQAGLRFERQFARALSKTGYLVEHNPWFLVRQQMDSPYLPPHIPRYAEQAYCPDILFTPPLSLSKSLGDLIVIEVKRTYVLEAIEKLRAIYVPVVKKSMVDRKYTDVRALVVVQKLVPGSPHAAFTMREALALDPPLMQWIGTGPVVL